MLAPSKLGMRSLITMLLISATSAFSLTFPIPQSFPGYGLFRQVVSIAQAKAALPEPINIPIASETFGRPCNCSFILEIYPDNSLGMFQGEISCTLPGGKPFNCAGFVNMIEDKEVLETQNVYTSIHHLENKVSLCPSGIYILTVSNSNSFRIRTLGGYRKDHFASIQGSRLHIRDG
jgi:hypothetical protein